jgi:hypothetical protein
MKAKTMNEIPLKEWLYNEAAKLGTTADAIRMRINRGKHSKPKIKMHGGLMFVSQ